MSHFFKFQNKPFPLVHLCCGERSLGAAEIKINNLIQNPSINNDFKIHPPLAALKSQGSQTLNTSLITVKIELSGNSIIKTIQEAPKISDNPISVNPKESAAPSLNEIKESTTETKNSPKEQKPQSNKLEDPKNPDPPKNCRFSFTTVIESISNFYSPFTGNMHIRFKHSFLNDSILSTKPIPVKINENKQVLINFTNKAYFGAFYNQLLSNFKKYPIEFQLWSENLLIGRGQVKLDFGNYPTIIGEDYPPGGGTEKVGFHCFRKGYSVPMVTASGNQVTLGHLNVAFSYKNFDPEQLEPLNLNLESNQENNMSNSNQNSARNNENPINEDPRQKSEYKIALELEVWKEQEKDKYLKALELSKKEAMEKLTEEFKKFEIDRENAFRKKVSEYEKLEKDLKSGLVDLDEREKHIAGQEKELTEIRDNIVADKERFLLDSKSNLERAKKDFAHELILERRLNENLKKEIEQKDENFKKISKDLEKSKNLIDKLNSEINERPNVLLENENKFLLLEKQDLIAKLDAAVKSKNYYKAQWSKALTSLSQLKEEHQEMARKDLKKETEELSMLKKKLLLNAEQNRVLSTQKELSNMQQNLNVAGISAGGDNNNNTINQSHEKLKKELSNLHGTVANQGGEDVENIIPAQDPINQHAARLLQEREALMMTGAYTDKDLVIQQLDNRIREAL